MKIIFDLRRGIIFALLAPLFFSIMNVLAKFSTAGLPSSEVVFFRSIISSSILLAIIGYRREPLIINNASLLILRGIFGACGLLGVFYTLSKIKLADASILLQLNPIFVALFAAIFLKEKLPKNFFLLFGSALLGAGLIINPTTNLSFSFPALIGVLSAISAAMAYTCVRQLSKTNSTNIIILFYMLIASILSFPLMLSSFVMPNFFQLMALLGIGLTSSLAQICLTKAYQLENAATVALISYIGVLLHFFWGALLWGEWVSTNTIFGAFFIMVPCLLILKRPLARP